MRNFHKSILVCKHFGASFKINAFKKREGIYIILSSMKLHPWDVKGLKSTGSMYHYFSKRLESHESNCHAGTKSEI